MIDLKELKTITKAAEMVTCIIDRRGDRAVFMKTITPDIVIELLDRLEAAEKVCYSLFTDFCEWQVDVDALKEWQDKYEKQYLAEYEAKQEVNQCVDQQQKKS